MSDAATSLRSTVRGGVDGEDRTNMLGFRVARDLDAGGEVGEGRMRMTPLIRRLFACGAIAALSLAASTGEASAQGTEKFERVQPQRPTKPPQAVPKLPHAAEREYQALVARVKGGDLAVDFARMRALYTETSAYQPYGMSAQDASKAEQMARSGDSGGAVQLAEKALETFYVSLAAHYAAALAHNKLGDKQREAFHSRVWAGMMRAVLASGDGLTAATAYKVLTVSDEYHVLRALRLTPGKRAVAREEGRIFDRWEAKTPDGKDRLVYFDITLMFSKIRTGPQQPRQ